MTALGQTQLMSAPVANPARRSDGRPRRVLYAEDQVSSRIVTKAMLEKMGFVVDAVDDGEVAVEMAKAGAYDIILLDIEMPVMDGVTAARTIRSELQAYGKTPILALSAFLADSTENCPWRDAFDTAVSKPATSGELQRAIVRALEKHGAALDGAGDQIADVFASPWQSLRKTMPRGARILMVTAAAGEMQHVALAVAAAAEAGESEQLRVCRHSLKGLALNFGLNNLSAAIAATSGKPQALDILSIFSMIQHWRDHNCQMN